MALGSRPSCSWLFVVPLALVACVGYRTPLNDPNSAESPAGSETRKDASADFRKDASADLRGSASTADSRDVPVDLARRDTQPDAARDMARFDATKLANCVPGNEYVLVLGDKGTLYRFDPNSLGITPLGPPVSCAATASDGRSSLNSMTVSPLGHAYISNHAGNLCLVDITTLRAQSTPFDPALVSNSAFGMALLPDNSPSGQTLYVSVQHIDQNGRQIAADTLSRVNLNSYSLTEIGRIRQPGDREEDLPSAELTAGSDGKTLYGFAVGVTSSLLLTIESGTATATDVIRVPAGYSAASFALASWQDAFFLFVGDNKQTGCQVYRYVKGEQKVQQLGYLDVAIIGAGVACRR